jgi:hypothetical protein
MSAVGWNNLFDLLNCSIPVDYLYQISILCVFWFFLLKKPLDLERLYKNLYFIFNLTTTRSGAAGHTL